jgi:O-antigen ligase
MAVWVAWIWWEPSLSPTRWGSLGLVVVLALVVGLDALGVKTAVRDRARGLMIAALLALVMWSFLSILWADSHDSALTGANKTMIYAASFLVFALWPWRDDDLTLLLGLFTAAVGISGVVALSQIGFAHEPGAFLEDGRLIHPMGYANSNAAVWTLGAIPAVYLAASRSLNPLLRGASGGIAVLLTALAVLAQSRGWLFVLPLAVALMVLVARERLRLLLALAITAAGTSAIVKQLLDVYERVEAGDLIEPTVDHAAILAFVAAASAGAIVAGWAILDRRVNVPYRARRALGGALAALAVIGIVVGSLALAKAANDPASAISDRWRDFTRGYSTGTDGSRFTGSLGTDRYQQWRTAWSEFVDHPVIGIGADNFAAPYLLHRHDSVHEPFYPHSTPLRLLSQLGIVGTVLFVSFAGIAVWLALKRRARAAAGAAMGAAATLAMFGYWLVHGSLDVFWEIPTLAAPVFGFLGAAAAPSADEAPVGERMPREPQRRIPSMPRPLVVASTALVFAAACAALLLPWLSFSYARSAGAVWREDPQLAYDRFELAADLNPLNAQPLVRKGLIAAELGDGEEARRSFQRALAREPTSWYAHLQLALLAADAGETQEAVTQVAQARALNPQDPVLRILAELLRAGAPIDVDLINRLYNERLNRYSYAYLTTRYVQVPPFTEEGS